MLVNTAIIMLQILTCNGHYGASRFYRVLLLQK